MELIDRYVNTFSEYLPEKSRDDIKKELQSNILDMLSEDPGEDEVKKVLSSLGNPMKLAAEYTQSKKYLIGPGLYDKFISVLKTIVPSVAVIVIVINLFEILFRPSAQGMINLSIASFTKLLVDTLQMVISALIWITVVFIILEKTGISEGMLPFAKKEWSVEDLPKIELLKKKRISRSETIFSIFFTILFFCLIIYKPFLFGWYQKEASGTLISTNLFNVDRLNVYTSIIWVFTLIQLIILAYKLIFPFWNKPLAIATAVFNLSLSVLVAFLAFDSTLINIEFIDIFAKAINSTYAQIAHSLQLGSWVFVIVFFGICIWDSINNFQKVKE